MLISLTVDKSFKECFILCCFYATCVCMNHPDLKSYPQMCGFDSKGKTIVKFSSNKQGFTNLF